MFAKYVLASMMLIAALVQPTGLAHAASFEGQGPGTTKLPLVTASAQAALTWVKVPGLPTDWIRSIAINPTSPHELLIAMQNEGVYRSADGGKTWKRVIATRSRQVAFAPSNPNIAYAAVLNNVMVSTDRGLTWKGVWPKELAGGGWALAIDPSNADHVFVGLNQNAPMSATFIYETTNRGQTWTANGLKPLANLEGIISLAFDPANPAIVWAGGNTDQADNPAYTRLWKSTNGGRNWTLITNGFPVTKRITRISYDACDANQIFVARQKHGATSVSDTFNRRTDTSGQSWVTLPWPNWKTTNRDDEFAISPLAPCPVFMDMQRSIDSGRTWQDIRYNFNSLMADPAAVWFSAWAADPWNNVLWAGTREHGLFYLSGAVPVN